MSSARYLVGDVFDRMAELEPGSIDLVLTSPPFLALRSYLPDDHPDKDREIGGEPDPAAFLDTLLALTAAWRGLIAPHGSIAVELGDTYAGSGSPGGDYNEGGIRAGQPRTSYSGKRTRTNTDRYRGYSGGSKGNDTDDGEGTRVVNSGGDGWPLNKSMCGIPHLYHLSLAYGFNLLTGEPSPAGRWRIRNVVAWCRPNPTVGALGDKYRPATSFLTIATVAQDRYFDLDAVRTPSPRNDNHRAMSTQYQAPGQPARKTRASDEGGRIHANAGGAPPLDWWEIPTEPYPGSHYATWPSALLERPIKSMVPRRVCTTCGKPSTRITAPTDGYAEHLGSSWAEKPERRGKANGSPERTHHAAQPVGVPHIKSAERNTTGWTDCGHDTWRRGVVLDPFAGSGTTLAVATGHGVDAIGIDLDDRNVALAERRVGMFLESVEYPVTPTV